MSESQVVSRQAGPQQHRHGGLQKSRTPIDTATNPNLHGSLGSMVIQAALRASGRRSGSSVIGREFESVAKYISRQSCTECELSCSIFRLILVTIRVA